ncbi:MAG: TylF/MycF/NovP-related O-methyltransferase [Verrucomicrobiota bacterium]
MQEPSQTFSMLNPQNQTKSDLEFQEEIQRYYQASLGTDLDKLRNFQKYVPRQALSLFLAKNELFKEVVGVHGHIIECGVFLGGGLMTWAQLSAIYEPVNHVRRVVGFDTFDGFPSISNKDMAAPLPQLHTGGLKADSMADLKDCARLYDKNRPIGHIPRVELVQGDATQSIPDYVRDNPHLVVALLYLDFDLFEPTLAALDFFLPRMPKGAVLAFDELNQKNWPGETLAVLQNPGLRNLRIRRFPFSPQLSYAILE